MSRNTVIQLPHKNGQSSLSLLLRDIKVQPKGGLCRDILLYKDILYTNRQSFPFHVIHWWRAYHVRLAKLDQRVDTIKREMFSQKSVRRFVGDSSAFVMGAMFLASALNRSISPGISTIFQYFRG